ncbi:MAG: glycosyltransferase family 4 protein [Vicinamibacterales bacterium]|nr:glycosyltransferase family 4 protein [Vicinamibacterales bacterium]
MRILLITETVPYPLDGGGRVKTWHTLQALAREHEVHCHAFVRDERQRAEAMGPLGEVCASVTLHLVARSLPREAGYLARSLATGLPFTVARHYAPRVMDRVAADCRRLAIDVAYCDHLSTIEYGRRLALPVVHDAHNVEHRIYERYAGGLSMADPRRLLVAREARRLLAYEREAYRGCAMVFAVSEVDAGAIAALAPGVPVVTVPIAVGASGLRPPPRLADGPEVLFVGALDWPPNAEAVDWLLAAMWPDVLREFPTARLTIVGRGQAPLAARWRRAPAVRFTGRVESVEPWFAASRAMVVPLRSGSGMRVKILDALARGLPVVTTSVGVEGIDAVPGEHVMVADTPAAFVAATLRVLRERDLAERLSREGRALALARYDSRVVGALQLEAVRRLAEARQAQGSRVHPREAVTGAPGS